MPDPTARGALTDLLGFTTIDKTRFQVTHAHSCAELNVVETGTRTFAELGASGVHHVAFGVKNDEELLEFQRKIEASGFRTSDYLDRFYFYSLYFRAGWRSL